MGDSEIIMMQPPLRFEALGCGGWGVRRVEGGGRGGRGRVAVEPSGLD